MENFSVVTHHLVSCLTLLTVKVTSQIFISGIMVAGRYGEPLMVVSQLMIYNMFVISGKKMGMLQHIFEWENHMTNDSMYKGNGLDRGNGCMWT